MRRIERTFMSFALFVFAGCAATHATPVPTTTPVESPATRLAAVTAEFAKAESDYWDAFDKLKLKDDETTKYLKDHPAPTPDNCLKSVWDIVNNNEKQSVAMTGLVWILNHGYANPENRKKSLALLRRDFIASGDISPVCQLLSRDATPAAREFLEAALDKNPDRQVKGSACYALAKNHASIAQMINNLKGADAAARDRYLKSMGESEFDRITKLDPAELTKNAEKLYDRILDSFADVKYGKQTLGDVVRAEMFEARSLVIGKPAPEIEAEDLDGVRFKLSDYRGKIVVLDFWGNW
ncbi:MAG: redoxin domain-containing protein [Planctomycetes bacterium]|nr:redoxin domain-containing protein [Planctomycetota bacterium]